MPATTNLTSAHQLFALQNPGRRFELIQGELRMMSPAGGRHGRVALRIGSMLEQHVRTNTLGETFAAETGFLLETDPDTVRAPDAAFVSAERFTPLADTSGYLPIAPDLVIEVVSPNDTSTEVEEKATAWIGFGVRLVLVVDPDNRSIRSYREHGKILVHYADDMVDAQDTVPGWHFRVDSVV